MKRLKTAIIMIITLGLMQCTSTKIEVVQFSDTLTLNEGQTGYLKWAFKNAYLVKVEDREEEFMPEDSLLVKPKLTTMYRITAINQYQDTVSLTSLVNLIKADKTGGIMRGPVTSVPKEYGASEIYSEYFKGISQFSVIDSISQFKIVKTKRTNDKLLYDVLFLDNYGNYITGIPAGKLQYNVTNQYGENVKELFASDSYDEKTAQNNENPLNIGFLIDNSAASSKHNEILEFIKKSSSALTEFDKLQISMFNESVYDIFPLKQVIELQSELNNPLAFPSNRGLNALYRSTFQVMETMESVTSEPKTLIIITYLDDNSSLTLTANDLEKIALENNFTFYIIGIGTALRSSSFKYLASRTGGRYYHIDSEEDEFVKLQDVINEILFQHRNYYRFESNYDINKAEEIYIKSIVTLFNENLIDSCRSYLEGKEQFAQYQALALFNEKEFKVEDEYFTTIAALANVLIDNPQNDIELIGHSGLEGDNKFNNEISLNRAIYVKRKLVEYGVNEHQIKVRGEGSRKPLYMLEQNEWQKMYNRRVTLRWLDPSLLPYEILAEAVKTEEEAKDKLQLWEDRGYNVYFDIYREDDYPVYRIKIWGYSSLEEAKEQAQTLSKKYKKKFIAE